MFSKSPRLLLAALGMLTLVGFSALGWVLATLIQGRSLEEVFFPEARSWNRQLLDGTIYGLVASANILWLLYNRILDQPRHFFEQLIRRFNITLPDIFFLSLCAGIGEEWLFRGAVQHWLGIWLTALAFVALHGYLDPRDWRISLYGVLMVVIVAGMGYLYNYSGLIAAMVSHAIIDIAIFISLKYFPGEKPPSPEQQQA
ncbi:MAG: CPBP family intramembrane metalloprotease [Bacteroidetes bacterium]|nr:CPBP family intramembrane metalloprotease [Bacteroidota bacterium]